MVYCKICHKELYENAEICPDCGVRNARSIERIPELSMILSLIIPGLGQSYNGQKVKAMAFFNMGLVLFLATMIYRVEFLSMVDKVRILSLLDNIEFVSINKESLIPSLVYNMYYIYPIFVAINVYDAYRTARKINAEI